MAIGSHDHGTTRYRTVVLAVHAKNKRFEQMSRECSFRDGDGSTERATSTRDEHAVFHGPQQDCMQLSLKPSPHMKEALKSDHAL